MILDCKECSDINILENTYSQKGEELIIQNIFNVLSIKNGFCVEFGAYDGTTVSNTKKLRNNGWNSCLVDCDYYSKEVDVYRINKNNVNTYFLSKNIPIDLDLLSVDIDGIDLYVVEEMLKVFKPKVIVAEFNRYFAKGISKTVQYDDNFAWEGGTIYYGASYTAFEKMFAKYGYKIGIVQEQNLYAFCNKIELKNEQVEFIVHSDQPTLKNLDKFIDY